METSIITNTLTDNSKTFAVFFVDGSTVVNIDCIDEAAAMRLQAAFADNACFATVN